MEKEFGSIDAFREEAKTTPDKTLEDAKVLSSFDTEVKASEEEGSRVLSFIISTDSVDRQGDTIAIDGWLLDNYKKNPVVLWGHDPYNPPVGRSQKTWIEGKKLKSDAEFTPPGMLAFNDTIFEMYKQGFLKATSVGFSPKKYAFSEDPQRRYGIDFLQQELLEFSMVCIPANAEALIAGKSAGIKLAPVLEMYERLIQLDKDSHDRVVRLAESLVGGDGKDGRLLAWGEAIIAASGRSLLPEGHVSIPKEQMERMNAAATKDRLRRKRARELDLIRYRGA